MPDLPTPETREEMFLASAAGESVTVPTPVTREEQYLAAIAAGGGGGGGGGGVLVVNVTTTVDGSSYTHTCDKTAGEMLAAMQSGVVVIKPFTDAGGYTLGGSVACYSHESDYYSFSFGNTEFGSDSADRYPYYQEGGK